MSSLGAVGDPEATDVPRRTPRRKNHKFGEKIDAALDLSWLRSELAPHYSSMGRPSIKPELVIRMLVVGYLFAIRSERLICREVHVTGQGGPRTAHRVRHDKAGGRDGPGIDTDTRSISSARDCPCGQRRGDDDYVIGPEVIGGSPMLPDGSPARFVADFRTGDGHIKRQAARFRVYAHLKDGSVVEVTARRAVNWRVAIANLKAGWYEFNQAMDLPRGLSRDARQRNRDAFVPGGRAALDIVPQPRSDRRAQVPRRRIQRRHLLGQAGLSRRVADRRRRPAAVPRRARRVGAFKAGMKPHHLRQQ